MWDGIWQDVRYVLRTLSRSPALAAIAVASLSLGIGVNIAIFGYADSALFKPLPVERPGELVSLYHRGNQTAAYFASSYPEFEFYLLARLAEALLYGVTPADPAATVRAE
jgi:hypothetical protein